jgi:type I restriction enzyme R subunit
MRGHSMIQAISRVNRVFSDKPHGLIVDYIGIGDDLREATAKYTAGGGKGNPAPSLDENAVPEFLRRLDALKALLPEGQDYGGWRKMKKTECEDLYSLVYGHLAEDDELREDFLKAEQLLSLSFLLVKHIDSCRLRADEVIFYQCVRKQVTKAMPGKKPPKELEHAVRDLVDESVESVGVVDIFKAAGIEKADMSILDDQFLQTFKDRPQANLRLKLLEQLMRDEIHRRQRSNLTQAKSFQELLQATLQKYHNRLIDAAAVIQALVQMRKEMTADDARAKALDLESDELAFYDAVAANYATIYEPTFLRDLVHEVVQTLKKNLKVDWAAPHRQQVYSAIRAAVQRTLQRRGVKPEHLEPITLRVMEQAATSFANWPIMAA